MISEKLKYSVGFQGGIQVGDQFWFSSFLGNALLCCNNKGKIKYVGKFPEENVNASKLYGDIKFYHNKLIFVPLGAQNIAIYDLSQKEFISIPLTCKKNQTVGYFLSAIINNGYMYMFPSFYPGILKLNLENWNMELIDGWVKEVDRYIVSPEDAYFRSDFVKRGNLIYLPFCNAHAVLELNLFNENIKIFNVGETGYSTIADDGTFLWMSPRNKGAIVHWDPTNGNIESYHDFPQGYNYGSAVGSFCYGDYYWIFPERANKVLKVNLYNGIIMEDIRFSDNCNACYSRYSIWNAAFIYCKMKDNVVILCTGRSCETIKVNLLSGNIERKVLKIPDEIKAVYENRDYHNLITRLKAEFKEKFYIELVWNTLTDFFLYSEILHRNCPIDKEIGRKIYSHVKGTLDK